MCSVSHLILWLLLETVVKFRLAGGGEEREKRNFWSFLGDALVAVKNIASDHLQRHYSSFK